MASDISENVITESSDAGPGIHRGLLPSMPSGNLPGEHQLGNDEDILGCQAVGFCKKEKVERREKSTRKTGPARHFITRIKSFMLNNRII